MRGIPPCWTVTEFCVSPTINHRKKLPLIFLLDVFCPEWRHPHHIGRVYMIRVEVIV